MPQPLCGGQWALYLESFVFKRGISDSRSIFFLDSESFGRQDGISFLIQVYVELTYNLDYVICSTP